MKATYLFGAGSALALLASAALAGQAQPRPQVQPRATPAPAAQATSGHALLPTTQALLDGYVNTNKMPGIVTAIGFGPFPTVFLTAGRQADGASARPVDGDTLWRVYSMTKPITGMAAMMLVEDGRLRLDQPISDFFPAYKSMKVLTSPASSLDARPTRTPITVRHLLTHTAGLGYNIISTGPIKAEYEKRGITPGAVNMAVEREARPARPASLQAFAERVAALPLVYEPGTRWSYSIGLDVLAAVVEKAGGMPFERFVQTRLFDPLGMRSSFWTVPAGEAARLADNYAFIGDNRVPLDPAATSVYLQPPSFPYGGAGLVMSARDYDRFLHMLQNGGTLDGKRVMKAETVALAMSNLLPAGVTFGGIGGGTGGTDDQVAMGFGAGGSVYLADRPGGPSRGTYGWGGAAGTIAFVDPVKKTRGTVMVNYFPADRWPLRQEIVAALAQDAARLQR